MVKAWKISPYDYSFSVIVFAETVGKAKSYALGTDGFESSDYTNIRAERYKKADKLYNGQSQLYWDNDEDRLFLVKECGWTCGEYFDTDYCKYCCAKDFCENYNDYIDDKAVQNERYLY